VATVKKADLVSRMADKSGLNKKQAEAALDAFVVAVQEALQAGEKVQLVGFGTFEAR
jgi:DNA-binding protein HU-beta